MAGGGFRARQRGRAGPLARLRRSERIDLGRLTTPGDFSKERIAGLVPFGAVHRDVSTLEQEIGR